VRREDQEKINRFSRLHQRETVLEEKLKGKQVIFASISFEILVSVLNFDSVLLSRGP
jgi:hypothetical protein